MKIRFVCADNCHDMQAPVTLKKGHFSRVISPIFKGTSSRELCIQKGTAITNITNTVPKKI